MRANAVILIVIGMLLLVGTAAAVVPDTVSITSNKNWIIANGVDQSVITVEVTNTTLGAVANANVVFSMNNSLGTLSSMGGVTGPSGTASTTFKSKTTSGATVITAQVTYSGADGSYTNTVTLTQNIDHDSPFYNSTISPLFTYKAQGNVTEVIPFTVSIYDQWGNPIDNKNPSYTHIVGLHLSSAIVPDDSYFIGNFTGSGTKDIFLSLNSNGALPVNIKLPTKTGTIKILMDSFEGKIPTQIKWITVLADTTPYSITGVIDNGGVLPVSTTNFFTIDYYLYDKYGNKIQNSNLWIFTNLSGESKPELHLSDENGLIRFTYGPKISVLTSNITAYAALNSSVRKSIIARFVTTGQASNLFLTITPQTMASGDTDPAQTTQMARVVGSITDSWGNPVGAGTPVIFTISDIKTTPFNATSGPSFDSKNGNILTKTLTTDSNGNAIVNFYPGSFVTSGLGYSDSATASCIITATTPNLTSTSAPAEWKNFAYLSVSVNATPQTVLMNDSIDVTIRITGDGYKMVQVPITVVLDMDATSNLAATSDGTNGKTRWINAQEASSTFVKNMSPQDQIGLVTHGEWTNYVYWQSISNITYNRDIVLAAIPNLTPSGGLGGNATTLKDSVLAASDKITGNPLYYPGEIDAIITIGANSYAKNSGDLAAMKQATWDDHKIRIFSILYVSTINSCDGQDAQNLIALTNATHGKFYCAISRPQVDDFFKDIYQNLSTIAGVNTSMNLDFEHVSVNSTPMNGTEVFDYVFIGPESPPQPISKNGRTRIIDTTGNQSVINQTAEWNNNGHLNFTIGTIHTKESWETTFRLKVNKEGLIDLFGPGSKISYNGGTGMLNLPNTTILSINNTIPQGLNSGALSVINLQPDCAICNKSVNMTWNLNYTGAFSGIETYYYCRQNLPSITCDEDNENEFTKFGNGPEFLDTNGYINRNTIMNVASFPEGFYKIKVKASVPGVQSAQDFSEFTKPLANGTVSIILR